MSNVILFPLLDGALVSRQKLRSREEAIRLMAEHLVGSGCWQNERDAIMSLMWCEQFSRSEVVLYLDDARDAARDFVQQIAVAREMGAS